MLFSETEEKIFSDLMLDIVNNTNLRRASPGSKTRAIALALAKKLGQMYRKFDANIGLSFLDGAEGKYLDFFGDMMGVPRLGEKQATISASERNLKVYVDTGTFGDINGGNPILLTKGTIVSTGINGTGITYTIPYNIVLSALNSEAYVPAISTRSGESQNVGKNQLIYHDFTAYTDIVNNTLKITNDAEVINGEGRELEANYRYRIANQVIAAESANLTAVRMAALSTPGVADLVFVPYNRGLGTSDVIIKSTLPKVPNSLLSAVQEAINNVTAHGNSILAKKPKETGVSIVGTLTFRKNLSPSDQQIIINNVTANVIDYVNNLDIGEELIVNEVVERIMATSSDIKNVGTAGKPLDSLYLYKESRLEDNKVRNIALGDVTPQQNEKLYIEDQYAGSTPVLFKTA